MSDAAYVHPLILRLRCFRNRDINLKEVYTIVNGSTKKICKLNKTQSMLVSIRESLGMWVYVCVCGGGGSTIRQSRDLLTASSS